MLSSKPVAITVTITSSFKFSLITAPKIVLISVLAAFLTTSAASSASNKVSELPPVILIIASVAPSIVVSSNGLDTACLAASTALFSPTPIPIPIIALPRFYIIVLTSAKSKFTKPDTAIKSDID